MAISSRATLMLAATLALLPLSAQAQAPVTGLPDGNGKELVAGMCIGCHQIEQITRSSGYSREHWKELIGTMIDLSPDQNTQSAITEYLAEKFPPNTLRAPKIVPGPVQVEFKEWQTPTLGQRTRDPVEAPDGTIWWVGQFGNLIGRLNPATGEMKEYPLPPNANAPYRHGRCARQRLVQRQQERHGRQVRSGHRQEPPSTRCPTPRRAIRTPSSSTANGIMWFTLQQCQHDRPARSARPAISSSSARRTGCATLRRQDRRRRHAVGVVQRRALPDQGRSRDMALTEVDCRLRARRCGASTSLRTA